VQMSTRTASWRRYEVALSEKPAECTSRALNTRRHGKDCPLGRALSCTRRPCGKPKAFQRSRSAAPGTFVTELSCTIRRAIQPRHCQSCRGRRRRSRERPHGRSALVAVPRSTHHSLTSARPDCTRQLRADRSTGTSRSRLRSAGGSATRRRGLGADEFPYCLVTTYESDLRKAAGAVLRLQAITEETSRSRLVKA